LWRFTFLKMPRGRPLIWRLGKVCRRTVRFFAGWPIFPANFAGNRVFRRIQAQFSMRQESCFIRRVATNPATPSVSFAVGEGISPCKMKQEKLYIYENWLLD
jgi:hypothetical protein